MMDKRKVIPHCDLMDFLEASRYETNMFESLFLEIFNEESCNALVICSYLKMTISIVLILVCLKLI